MWTNVSSYLFGRPGGRQTVRDVSRQLGIASDFRATHPATHSFVLRDCWKIATELWVLIQMPVAFEFPIDRRWMAVQFHRSEVHTSELQSLMRISYAVCCWKNKTVEWRRICLRSSKYWKSRIPSTS